MDEFPLAILLKDADLLVVILGAGPLDPAPLGEPPPHKRPTLALL
jgi:hypothetical protein